MKTLLSLFEDSAALVDNPLRATDVDWRALGVEHKYIIFLTGRCGSTWLTHLLADTGFLGKPDEFFNEEYIPFFSEKHSVSTLRNYLSAIIAQFKGPSHFGFEIDPIRYSSLAKVTNFSEIFLKSQSTTFFMTRTDILSQAYSFAAAKKTGQWHVFSNDASAKKPADEDVTDRSLWVELFLILEQEFYMKEEFKRLNIKPIPITYEELLTDKFSVITTIMTALGVKSADIQDYLPKIKDKTRQMSHETKHRVLGEFLERNWRDFEAFLVSRHSPDIDALRAGLKEHQGIDIGPFRRLRKD